MADMVEVAATFINEEEKYIEDGSSVKEAMEVRVSKSACGMLPAEGPVQRLYGNQKGWQGHGHQKRLEFALYKHYSSSYIKHS